MVSHIAPSPQVVPAPHWKTRSFHMGFQLSTRGMGAIKGVGEQGASWSLRHHTTEHSWPGPGTWVSEAEKGFYLLAASQKTLPWEVSSRTHDRPAPGTGISATFPLTSLWKRVSVYDQQSCWVFLSVLWGQVLMTSVKNLGRSYLAFPVRVCLPWWTGMWGPFTHTQVIQHSHWGWAVPLSSGYSWYQHS